MALTIPVDERSATLAITDEAVTIPASSPYEARLVEVPAEDSVAIRRVSATTKVGTGSGGCASGGYYTGLATRSYEVRIDTGGDVGGGATFKWKHVGDTEWHSTLLPIENTDPIIIELGVTVAFTSGTGTDFVVDDYWTFDAEYWTEVDAAPTATKEFEVDYATDVITFYSADASKTVYVSYEGRGSLVKASDIGQLVNAMEDGETIAREISGVLGLYPKEIYALTYAATLDIDWSDGVFQSIELTGDVVLTFSNPYSGGKMILRVKQDGTGGHAVTWPTSLRYGTDITSIDLTQAVNKQDYIGFIWDPTASKYDVVSHVKGF